MGGRFFSEFYACVLGNTVGLFIVYGLWPLDTKRGISVSSKTKKEEKGVFIETLRRFNFQISGFSKHHSGWKLKVA